MAGTARFLREVGRAEAPAGRGLAAAGIVVEGPAARTDRVGLENLSSVPVLMRAKLTTGEKVVRPHP